MVRVMSERSVGDEVTHVAQMFGEVARQLLKERDLTSTLNRVVALADEHLDSCECAGVSIVEGRTISSPASSGKTALTMDRIQQEVDEGPCLDALREHEIFQTGDLRREVRWTNFSQRGFDETGVLSILSVRLFAQERTFGALNLYSTKPDAFDDVDVALASVFATHAAVAIKAVRREHDLEARAESRDLIGRAKGILMTRQHVTDEAAFDMLRCASQRLNVKLVEVADSVNYTGEIPP
jgi:GAF domain-containing protein